MLFIKLAWRNLFRNKRRTIIAGLAIGLGLAALIFVDAIYFGEEIVMVKIATSTFVGEAQINRANFRQTQETELTIANFDEVMFELESEAIVEKFTPRTSAFGTITSPANMSGVNVFGIAPETERDMSYLDEAIVDGEYFTGDNPQNILIGKKLAEILDVEIGDRTVLTVSQAGTGVIVQELFRVSGIFDFGDRSMNRGVAFIRIGKAREMLGIGNTAHTIAIAFTDPSLSENKTLPFWEKFSRYGNEAVSWTEIFPLIASIDALMIIGKLFIAFILMGVVVFVILNTLFMSLFERMFEFGVLRAVGTRPFVVAKLLLFEAGALSLVSIVIGSIIGFIVTWLISQIGIDFTGVEFAGIALREKIYPTLTISQFIIYPVAVFIFTIIVGIYPAVHAARIAPAKAMRRSF
ncbi:hypothetical protein DRQ36_00295 [bacterium]|nr:MAG: hypothetical protein DRQ36_00295 [bacterium]